MTTRLQEAIQRLSSPDLQRVTEFAEALVKAGDTQRPEHLQLDWSGAAGDAYPEYQSGVDAAHAALRMMRESLDRELSR